MMEKLKKQFLDELETALANDAYAAMQSLLKNEHDDFSDENVELINEDDRELFDRLKDIHFERHCIHNMFINNKINLSDYEESLFDVKDSLEWCDIDLDETNEVISEYGLE